MNGVRRQLFTVAAVLACAGCSQTAALAPVGGKPNSGISATR